MPKQQPCQPVVFLDRDGVLNIDHGYTHQIIDLEFTPTAIEAVHYLNQLPVWVIVVSNQSGVARGYFSTYQVIQFHHAMIDRLAQSGAKLDRIYFCPFYPGLPGYYGRASASRKPGIGMLQRAAKDFSIDKSHSFLIGDSETDIQAASHWGIPGILVPKNTVDLLAVVQQLKI